MRNKFTAALLITALLLSAGCVTSPSGGERNTAGALVKPEMNPAQIKELLAAIINARIAADTLVATGDMRIQDRANNFSLSVQIENFAAVYPDRLRMKATKLAGAVEAFDALMRDGNIAFYVPRQRVLYIGKVADLKNSGSDLDFSPEILISRLLRGSRGLLNFDWKPVAGNRNNRNQNLTEFEQAHSSGQNYLRIAVDLRQRVLREVSYFNARNERYFAEEYENYREIGGGVFPARFTLRLSGADRFVRLNLKNIDLTRRAAELSEAFSGLDNLDMEKVSRQPLQQARIESDDQVER